jgi:drug/metabolite transporter (DMT)-like permease
MPASRHRASAILARFKRLIVARDGGKLFGVLMGVLHGGEPLTLKTLVGMALTIGGIVVLTIG